MRYFIRMAAMAAAIAGCGGSTPTGTANPTPGDVPVLTATLAGLNVSGVNGDWKAMYAQSGVKNGTFHLQASDFNFNIGSVPLNTISLDITLENPAVGTFLFDTTFTSRAKAFIAVQTNSPGHLWSTTYPQAAPVGSLTITSMTATSASGTFSFNGWDYVWLNAASIKNGVFSVTFSDNFTTSTGSK